MKPPRLIRDFGPTKSDWLEHWTNGGTGVTKLSPERAPLIADSVQAFGNLAIFIKGDELHSTIRDLSDFWDFHRKRHPEKPIL